MRLERHDALFRTQVPHLDVRIEGATDDIVAPNLPLSLNAYALGHVLFKVHRH